MSSADVSTVIVVRPNMCIGVAACVAASGRQQLAGSVPSVAGWDLDFDVAPVEIGPPGGLL